MTELIDAWSAAEDTNAELRRQLAETQTQLAQMEAQP